MGTRVGAQKHTPHIDSTSTHSPFAGRLVGRMQYAPTLPAEKSNLKGWRGITFRRRGDESVFHFFISNRLSDRHPCRGVLNTPLVRLSSTLSPFAGRLVGRMQYAPTLSKKDKVSSGRYFLLSGTMVDKYVSLFSMYNRLLDRYPGRGVLNTPHIDSTSTHSPFAGRLVGRMQYAPTLSAEKSDLKGWYGVMFGAKGEESVFHSIMFNRLSDRHPGRGVLHTPHIDSTSTPSPLAGRLVGRMQYAPTLPAEKSDLKGWRGVMFRRRGDSSIKRTKKGRIFWREDRRQEV